MENTEMKTIHGLCIVGDSLTGKSTLATNIVKYYPELFMESISATSRTPREGEKNGVDYHFVKREYFLEHRDDLLEFSLYDGNYYGTPLLSFIDAIEQDKVIIFVLEQEGALKLNDLDYVTVGGEKVSLNIQTILLDIEEAKICRHFEERLNINQDMPYSERQKEMALFRERLGREKKENNAQEKEKEQIKSFASVTRRDYLPENFFGDIIKVLPTEIKSSIENKKTALAEKEQKFHNAYNDLAKELRCISSSKTEINKILKKGSVPNYILDEVASTHNIDNEELKNYAVSYPKYPNFYILDNGVDCGRCRISNKRVVMEALEDEFIENKNYTANKLLSMVVGVYLENENGYTSMALKDIVDLKHEDIFTERILNGLSKNDIIKQKNDDISDIEISPNFI